MTQGSPVRRHYLVSQLKGLRARAGLSQEQVAGEMGWDVSKMYRIENGKFVRLNTEAVAALCRLYGASDKLSDELIAIAKAARKQKPWWFQYEDVAGNAFYGLENEATRIQQYAVGLVPGLLQHPDYIDALMARGFVDAPEERQRRREARMQRHRDVLERAAPPRVWTIIDESALRCPIGGPQVMCAQLDQLIELNGHTNLEIQVLPLAKGMAMPYGFTVLQLGDADLVGFIDVPPSGLFFEGSEELAEHGQRFEYLQAAALPLAETGIFLRQVMTDLERR